MRIFVWWCTLTISKHISLVQRCFLSWKSPPVAIQCQAQCYSCWWLSKQFFLGIHGRWCRQKCRNVELTFFSQTYVDFTRLASERDPSVFDFPDGHVIWGFVLRSQHHELWTGFSDGSQRRHPWSKFMHVRNCWTELHWWIVCTFEWIFVFAIKVRWQVAFCQAFWK